MLHRQTPQLQAEPYPGGRLRLVVESCLLLAGKQRLASRRRPSPEAVAGGRHVPADLSVGHCSNRLRPDPSGDRSGQVGEIPAPSGDHLVGVAEPPGGGHDGHPSHGLHGIQGQHPHQGEQAVVLEQAGEGGALPPISDLRPAMGMKVALAPERGLPVPGLGLRGHQHPESRQPGAPAEVEILMVRVESLVGRTDPVPRLLQDEHGA